MLIVQQAFRLVWATDKRAFLTNIVLQIVNGVALGAELIVGRRLLETIGPTGGSQLKAA